MVVVAAVVVVRQNGAHIWTEQEQTATNGCFMALHCPETESSAHIHKAHEWKEAARGTQARNRDSHKRSHGAPLEAVLWDRILRGWGVGEGGLLVSTLFVTTDSAGTCHVAHVQAHSQGVVGTPRVSALGAMSRAEVGCKRCASARGHTLRSLNLNGSSSCGSPSAGIVPSASPQTQECTGGG
jgi:hypothetical protein